MAGPFDFATKTARDATSIASDATSPSGRPNTFLTNLSPQVRKYRNELASAKEEQQSLTNQLKQLDKGSAEYDKISKSLTAVTGTVDALTGALNKQLATIGKQSKALGIAGKVAGVGAGLFVGFTGTIIALTKSMGDAARETLALSSASEYGAEALHQLSSGFDILGIKMSAVDLVAFEKQQRRVNTAFMLGSGVSKDLVIAYSALGLRLGETVTLNRDLYETLRALPLAQREYYAAIVGVNDGVLQAINLGYDWQEVQANGIARTKEQQREALEAANAMRKLGAEIKEVGADLAREFLPYVKAGAEVLIEITGNVRDWIKENPKWIKAIGYGALAVGALGTALGIAAGFAVTLAAATGIGLPAALTALGLGATVGAGVVAGGLVIENQISKALANVELDNNNDSKKLQEAVQAGSEAGSKAGIIAGYDAATRAKADVLNANQRDSIFLSQGPTPAPMQSAANPMIGPQQVPFIGPAQVPMIGPRAVPGANAAQQSVEGSGYIDLGAAITDLFRGADRNIVREEVQQQAQQSGHIDLGAAITDLFRSKNDSNLDTSLGTGQQLYTPPGSAFDNSQQTIINNYNNNDSGDINYTFNGADNPIDIIESARAFEIEREEGAAARV